jgi:hypothetical protein
MLKAGLGPGNSSTTIESTKEISVVGKVFQPTQNLVSLNGLKSIFAFLREVGFFCSS